MSEKDTIFKSSLKHVGIFNFRDFYKFCYDWLIEETGLDPLQEEKYEEKLKGDKKELKIEWKGWKKLTDYFRFIMEIKFEIKELKNVEIIKDGVKIKTNEGSVKITVKGTLEKDWEGKFERDAWRKFLRGVYEKWIIPSRIDQFEGKVFGACDEFLAQTKAYLALEGER